MYEYDEKATPKQQGQIKEECIGIIDRCDRYGIPYYQSLYSNGGIRVFSHQVWQHPYGAKEDLSKIKLIHKQLDEIVANILKEES